MRFTTNNSNFFLLHKDKFHFLEVEEENNAIKRY